MGVRIFSTNLMACLYCSTSGWAFGPIIYDDGIHDANERAEAFCKWLKVDARSLSDSELESRYSEFCSQEKEYWREKEQEEDWRMHLEEEN